MCGIAGIISSNLNESVKPSETMKKMCRALAHRGPDGEGEYIDTDLALGMTRLAVIDVEHAKQPFQSKDGEIIVLFNGEIYNHVELREQLQEQGYRFETHGDGEVIPYLYQEKGIEFIRHLRGMFAITLFDKKKRRLYLIRDRMGEKPIYYFKPANTSCFYYASEMKSLLEVISAKDIGIDPESIDLFLRYQYVPEPFTMYKEISKLPAGHFLELDVDTLDIEVQSYWSFTEADRKTGKDIHTQVKHCLEDIASIISRSDVPIGIALSGGIDSSVVAAIFASQVKKNDLSRAFTVGYQGEPKTDERVYARELSSELNIPLSEVEIKVAELADDFPNLVSYMDDPIGDIAAYSIYRVMKAAKDNDIKVVLNGIGADELFWGYPWVSAAVTKTNEQLEQGKSEYLYFYEHNTNFNFADKMSTRIYHKQYKAILKKDRHKDFYRYKEGKDVPLQIMDALCHTWLFSNLVALSDRLSMANSVELRSPFLEHYIVELAVSLNKKNKDTFRQEAKYDLKQAIKSYLPEKVLNRPKRGFTPPKRSWLLAVHKRHSHSLLNGYLMKQGYLSRIGLFSLMMSLKLPGFLISTTKLMYVYKLILLEIWFSRFIPVGSQ